MLMRSIVLVAFYILTMHYVALATYPPSDCGRQALVHYLALTGQTAQLDRLREQQQAYASLADIVQAAQDAGSHLLAFKIGKDHLDTVALPCIVHLNDSADGHFTVLAGLDTKQVQLVEQTGEAVVSREQFNRVFSGAGLAAVLPSGALRLTAPEQRRILGAHAAPIPATPQPNGPPPECPSGQPACQCPVGGAPAWAVNPVDLNLYVRDTPLWYTPSQGPSVSITLSFNNQNTVQTESPLGNKWWFNYGSFLVVDAGGQVTVTMPNGREDVYAPKGDGTYTYPYRRNTTLSKTSDSEYVLSFQDGGRSVYSTPGTGKILLTAMEDKYGKGIRLIYDNGLLTRLVDGDGKTTTLSYQARGLLTKIADPFGRFLSLSYDANRNLTSITDMGGFATQMEYDQNGNLSALVNQGSRTGFLLEPNTNSGWPATNYPKPGEDMTYNKRMTITHPDGGKEEFHYVGVGGYTWRVKPEHYVAYGQTNNSDASIPKTLYYFTTTTGTHREVSSINYPNGERELFSYEAATGRKLSESGGSYATSYTYTANGNLASVKEPNNQTTTYTYAANGVDVVEISNGLGTKKLTWDDHHNLTSYTGLDGQTTRISYTATGKPASVTNALDQTTSFAYSNNRLTEISRNGVSLASYGYDERGRVQSSASDGVELQYVYDNLDHLREILYPDGKKDSLSYNSKVNPNLLTQETERSGAVTEYSHDSCRRPERMINAEGGVERYIYDKSGNLSAFHDANNNKTTFSYDTNGNVVAKTFADGKSERYTYNTLGLLDTVTNARGVLTRYYYNAMGSLTRIDYGDDTPDVTLTYDTFNRLTRAVDGSGTTAFTYDGGSRLATVNGPWDSDTITYGYDALGRIVSVNAEGGTALSRSYDAMGRLTAITSGGQTFSYGYTSPGSNLIKTLERNNGTVTTYGYDSLHRLLQVANSGGIKTSYTYNQQDQRAGETREGGLPAPGLTARNGQSTVNQVNQILAETDPDRSFAYDADGNLIEGYTKDGYPFSAGYDAANRLIRLRYEDGEKNLHRIEYSYRYDDFLATIKRFANNKLVEETRIVRDGHLALQDRNGANQVVAHYTWGLNLGGGIGGLLGIRQNNAGYFPLYDGIGNIVAVQDSTGQTVAQYRYSAFGQLEAQTGTLSQPFGFSTKRTDAATGLVYYGYRFYNPQAERWLNRDPLGEVGGVNLYAFVQNDPVNWVDPEGLISAGQLGIGNPGSYGGQNTNESMYDECEENPCAGENIINGLIYDGCGNLIGEIGLQDPGLLDPTLLVGGAAGVLRKAGWAVSAGRYAHGGGGINLLKNGTRKFGLDYHSFKYKGQMGSRPHYHLGKTKSQMKKHRPWQGGWK